MYVQSTCTTVGLHAHVSIIIAVINEVATKLVMNLNLELKLNLTLRA